jgi:hypothetical protein
MNPKIVLGLFLSASAAFFSQSATAAVLSEQPVSGQQSSIEVDVVDLNRRGSSELILAENSSSNSSSNESSNNSSNSSSNESSNSSSNESSNSSSDSSSNSNSNDNSNSSIWDWLTW